MVLFQSPSLNFRPSLLCRLASITNIVGVKDEDGDMKQFIRQMTAVENRLELLCGIGEILAPSYFALGVKGFTSGLVNFMPQTPIKILRYLKAGALQKAAQVVKREIIPTFISEKNDPATRQR